MKNNISSFEQSLLDAEHLLGVQITAHDIAEVFHDADGRELLGNRRRSHRRHVLCDSRFGARCLHHCGEVVVKRAACEQSPFIHTCWKGLEEVVVPVMRNGLLCVVFFAGFWRCARRKSAWRGDRAACSALKDVPLQDAGHMAQIGRIINMLAHGMIYELTRPNTDETHPATRKAAILQFLRDNACRAASLNDLAHTLSLSPSRAGHQVKTLFGIPFHAMLTRKRMARAKILLLSTDYSVKEIAQKAGIPDEYHFNRTFRKIVGMPPGRFRVAGNQEME